MVGFPSGFAWLVAVSFLRSVFFCRFKVDSQVMITYCLRIAGKGSTTNCRWRKVGGKQGDPRLCGYVNS